MPILQWNQDVGEHYLPREDKTEAAIRDPCKNQSQVQLLFNILDLLVE